ncbi:MAG: hypothetical protein ABGX16_20385, partial [Pirellulales bacterium]
GSRPTARCNRHFVAIAVSKPQPESRALADCRRTLRLQAVVFSPYSCFSMLTVCLAPSLCCLALPAGRLSR